ncbi:MAG: hypothetical protein E2598_08005 [Sphingobium sp.]|nr:hypothetical protein [Sphingobium sp.]
MKELSSRYLRVCAVVMYFLRLRRLRSIISVGSGCAEERHGTRSAPDINAEMQSETPEARLANYTLVCGFKPPWLRILAGAMVHIAVAGCSAPPTSDEKANLLHQRPEGLVGEHFYICEDNMKIDVDFLKDGLTVDLKVLPDGESKRLSSPATGVPFFGDGINLQIVQGDIMIFRVDVPAQRCRRIKTGQAQR